MAITCFATAFAGPIQSNPELPLDGGLKVTARLRLMNCWRVWASRVEAVVDEEEQLQVATASADSRGRYTVQE